MFKETYPMPVARLIKPVSKLYYKAPPYSGFPFKIQFKSSYRYYQVNDNLYQNNYTGYEMSADTYKEWSAYERKLDKWLSATYRKHYPYPSDLKERHDLNRTIFLKSYENFNKLIELFGEYVISAERPINQEHYDMLLDGEKVLFRPQLFWRKYRYKIGFLSSPEFYNQHIPWLKEFFENRDNEDYRFNINFDHVFRNLINKTQNNGIVRPPRLHNRYYYYGYNLFLNHKEDIMMIKLRVSKDIQFVERVFRYDELGKTVSDIIDEKNS